MRFERKIHWIFFELKLIKLFKEFASVSQENASITIEEYFKSDLKKKEFLYFAYPKNTLHHFKSIELIINCFYWSNNNLFVSIFIIYYHLFIKRISNNFEKWSM